MQFLKKICSKWKNLLFLATVPIIIFSCDRKQKEPESREVFGTICTINLYESGTEKLYEKIFERLEEIETGKNTNIFEKKGLATEEIKNILEKENVYGATINLEGNIYIYGNKKDKSPWKIGIKNPANPDGVAVALITGLQDVAIVTSGIYSQNLPLGTEIKTDTGLLSMTVISENPVLAEKLSSKFFLMGTEDSFEFLKTLKALKNEEKIENLMIIAIQSDGKIHASKELEGYLGTILDDYSVIFR